MQEPRQKATLKDYGHAFVELLKNRNYVLLILISIFQNFALTIGKSPLVPFAMTMGIAAPIAGAMNGTYYLLVCIVRPFTGIAQDKINKKIMLTASLAIKAIAFVMIAFSHDYATYFAGRMVDAISFSLITTVFMSTTSLFIDRRTMGIGVGLFSGIPTLVVSAVPTLSMYIFKTYGGKYVYLAGAVALVVGILFVFMLKFPKEEKPAQKKKFSINDIVYLPAIPACMLNFFLAMLLTICDTYLVVMATERGIEGAEIYLTIKSLVNVVAGLGLGGLSDIMGSRKILIGACIATAVASVMYGCAQSLVLIIIACLSHPQSCLVGYAAALSAELYHSLSWAWRHVCGVCRAFCISVGIQTAEFRPFGLCIYCVGVHLWLKFSAQRGWFGYFPSDSKQFCGELCIGGVPSRLSAHRDRNDSHFYRSLPDLQGLAGSSH